MSKGKFLENKLTTFIKWIPMKYLIISLMKA